MNLNTATQKMKDEAYEYMAIRSVPGPFLIMSFFLVFVYISPIYEDQPTEILIIGILLLVNGIFRAFNEIGFKRLYSMSPGLWSTAYSYSISLTALVWGIFCLIIVAEYGINWISLLVLICTAGLSSGGIIAVIPNQVLSFTFQAFILLPTALYSFTLDNAAAYSISYMFLCYLVFMSVMSAKLHQEYWTSVQNVKLLDERAKELEIARDEAIKLAESKTVFLATMSHELRTPMNGILGMAQLLELSNLDKEQNEYVSTIQTSTNLLLNIINDILVHSKMESGKLAVEYHHFKINSLIDNIYNLIKPVTTEKLLDFRININSNCPTDLIGDEGKIRQVLLNLLGNAIKFTKQGSINIDVDFLNDEHENKIKFRVTDTGIGIPPEKQSIIFSDFTQADNSTTREYGGTGLGLTISKQLIELMNGHIGIESEKGKGSTFWFEIPIQHAGTKNQNENNLVTNSNPDFILDPRIQAQLRETMEDQFPQLIESHITSTTEIINNIQRCFKNDDTNKLPQYLNSLKSSSASIGAKALEAEINFIEKNLKNDKLLDESEYNKLLQLFEEMISALHKVNK